MKKFQELHNFESEPVVHAHSKIVEVSYSYESDAGSRVMEEGISSKGNTHDDTMVLVRDKPTTNECDSETIGLVREAGLVGNTDTTKVDG